MGGRFLTITVLVLMGFGLGTAYTWFDVRNDQAANLNRIAPAAGSEVAGGDSVGGSFTLTDHNGREVSTEAYGDKYKLIFFGFTHCPDVCPTGLQKITQAMGKLDEATAAKIQPLFITVDPERDTPEVMQTYVSQYYDSMIGLTGTPEQIKDVEKQYKVYAARVDDEHAHHGYSMNHSSYTFLMGPDDTLVTLFSGDESAADMVAEIEKIMSAS